MLLSLLSGCRQFAAGKAFRRCADAARRAAPDAGLRGHRFAPLLLGTLCGLISGCAWLQQLRTDPVTQSHRLTMQAQLAEDRGDDREALELLAQASRANPDDPAVHRALAQLQLKLGQTDSAAENLRYLTGQYPDDAEAFVQLARVLIDQQQYVEAQSMLKLALQSNPEHVEGLMLMGQIAERRHQYARALEYYHRVLNVNAGCTPAAMRIAEIQIQAGRPDCAAPLLRSVYRSREAPAAQRTEAGMLLALTYGQRSRWSDAATTLQEVLPQKPDVTADDVYRLAYARYRAGDMQRAYADALAAQRLQADHRPSAVLAELLREPQQTASLATVEHRVDRVVVPAGW